jgi:hypothetical protein
MGLEPTIPAFERAKTVHALDRAANVIGRISIQLRQMQATVLQEAGSFRQQKFSTAFNSFQFVVVDGCLARAGTFLTCLPAITKQRLLSRCLFRGLCQATAPYAKILIRMVRKSLLVYRFQKYTSESVLLQFRAHVCVTHFSIGCIAQTSAVELDPGMGRRREKSCKRNKKIQIKM